MNTETPELDARARARRLAIRALAVDGHDGAEQQTARQQVEEWLDAVALCFGLPEGRRWIDF